MKINDGILPRRSSSVWSFTAAFVDRKGAQENTERHRSIVVEVECVDRVLQLNTERLLGIEAPRDTNEALGEVAVDAPIARCVGVGQSVAGDIAADAEMIELRLVCPRAGFDIAQALSPCELRECHAQILIETREALDLVLAVVASNATPEGR